RNNRRYFYLVSGLLRCKECGYALCGSHPGRSYYQCLGGVKDRRPAGRQCSGRPIPAEVLDDLVWDAVKRLLQEPDVVFAEHLRRISGSEDIVVSLQQASAQKGAELRHLETEKDRMLDLYQHGSLTREELDPRLSKIRARMHHVQSEQAMLEREI